jgi:sortase A
MLLVRRGAALIALVLIAFGLAMLAYPAATDLYAARQQARLRSEFAAEFAAAPPGPGGPVPARLAMAVVQVPAIGLDTVMVQGTSTQALRMGPGHYPGTAVPCLPGNAAVAGHRTTYGHPFERLDELVPGEDITLTLPWGRCTYQVIPALQGRVTPRPGSAAWIIAPDDWSVVGPLDGSLLTLTTCNPMGSNSQRLVVRARLVAVQS